jgi:hypothetical protein
MIDQTPAEGRFEGPLFLVGMPRSGTKLLGVLLNQNPSIAISTLETDFLPYWIERWHAYGDLSDRAAFSHFYQDAKRLPYFINLQAENRLVDEHEWFQACRDYSTAGVFEALLRLEVGAPRGSGRVWVDKSPSYTRHVGLLKTHFPDARFVHIVRDVRDYCLSIHNAWGKNMFRAAQRWTEDVAGARRAGERFANDFLEVRYEDLLRDPRVVVERVCDLLEIEFHEDMTRLSRPTEWVGDARTAEIKSDNVEKYVERMGARTRRKIEAIAGGLLVSLGYPVDGGSVGAKPARVGKVRMLVYQIYDAISLFRSSVRERGFFGAVRWNARSLLTKR